MDSGKIILEIKGLELAVLEFSFFPIVMGILRKQGI